MTERRAGRLHAAYAKIEAAGPIPGRPICRALRRLLFGTVGIGGRGLPPFGAVGGMRPAQQLTYEMMGRSRNRFYSPAMWSAVDGYSPYDELGVDTARMRRWHPLNQSLYVANSGPERTRPRLNSAGLAAVVRLNSCSAAATWAKALGIAHGLIRRVGRPYPTAQPATAPTTSFRSSRHPAHRVDKRAFRV